MIRTNLLRPSVNAGEFSPRMAARIDLRQYPFAAETLENLILLPQGGFMRRPGTRFVAEVRDSAAATRLLRFRFSTEQAYVIEAGENYFRFYKDQGRISVAATDATIANGDFTLATGWVDRSQLFELPFDSQSGAFTPGLVITGANSAATGTIVAVNKGEAGTGDFGVLTLAGVSGAFQDNEAIADGASGAATANIPAPLGTQAAISHDAEGGRLNLDGLADDYAWAEQAVATTRTGQEHVLRFRVLGVAGDTAELRIGSAPTGNDLVDDRTVGVGYHAIAFTPTASPFHVQFRAREKTVQIDDAALLGDTAMELETPWSAAAVARLRSAQSADIRYFVDGDHPAYRLQRYGHASWSLEEVDFADGPYLDANVTRTILTPSATAGYGVAVSASRTEGINGGMGFKPTDVGRLVRILIGPEWGYGRIAAVNSPTEIAVDVRRDFGGTSGSLDWALGAWSDTTGHPKTVAFYEGRLAFAGTRDRPQSFWLSQSQDFENMRPDSRDGAVEDDDAIARTIGTTEVNAIHWMSPGPTLVLGTAGAQWVVRASLQDEPVTPAGVNAKAQTTRQCADLEALQVDEATLFVQAGRRRLLQYGYSPDIGGYEARDLTILAEHISEGGLAALAYQEEPWSIIWALRDDGVLAALTYRPAQDVAGWSRHVLGGAHAAGGAAVESLIAIPGNTAGGSADRDELWLVVRRTINGTTRRYVEFFEGSCESAAAQAAAFYVDCGISYDGAATDMLGGLGHLEGETVKVQADGAEHPDRIVRNGRIALDAPYRHIRVGLAYTSTYRSLKLEGGSSLGTALTQTKRVGPLGLVLHNTLGLKVGPGKSRLGTVAFRAVGDAMDAPVPLFTGEKIIADFPGEWETDPRIVIQSDAPLPMTVLAIVPHLETSDGA
ncbi:MAG: hypothetical protein JSU82_04895 [Rhodospirillales bacterium]|nr:MAG: hypothetical protein JSU82_04895 [Rhodospirillales bacterium]